MAATKPNESLASSIFTKSFAALAANNADTDLSAASGGIASRRIRIVDAGGGALTLTYIDGSTDTIIGCIANEVHEVQAVKIMKGVGGTTSVNSVTVYF